MELSESACRVLNLISETGDEAYLLGRRFDDSALSLVDPAAGDKNRTQLDSMLQVDRSLAEELLLAGYVENEALRGESINVVLRITERGREFLSTQQTGA
jgi:hypothetical protein